MCTQKLKAAGRRFRKALQRSLLYSIYDFFGVYLKVVKGLLNQCFCLFSGGRNGKYEHYGLGLCKCAKSDAVLLQEQLQHARLRKLLVKQLICNSLDFPIQSSSIVRQCPQDRLEYELKSIVIFYENFFQSYFIFSSEIILLNFKVFHFDWVAFMYFNRMKKRSIHFQVFKKKMVFFLTKNF